MSFYNTEDEERLVKEHTPLVVSLAFTFNPVHPYDYDDLISVGYIGLIKTIRSFDPSRGFQFSTLATAIIKREIIREINKVSGKHSENIEFDIPEYEEESVIDCLPDNISKEDKNILYLRFYQGMTFQEIGDKLGFTKQWANGKVNSIIDNIRKSNEEKTKNTSSE